MALEKNYDHKKVELNKADTWEKNGYFTAGDLSKPPFSIVIPPPNVTGKLHLGHALDTIPSDIIIRYKKAKGYDTLWVPGMDHAGIATQAKVCQKLLEEGIDYHDLGREGFLTKAWEWKDEYAKNIKSQWKAFGLSLDYTRERFTLDEQLNKAVNKVFVNLYEQGLIYQGLRVINWDPVLQTALSNIEVIHKDVEGSFYYFIYKLEDGSGELIIATTRPETMFGDTAVFVNPKDKRYNSFIGKKVINPANDKTIPVMADDYVDIEFGTGAMKCTPAHDINDYNLGKKYGLEFIVCMNKDASMNDKSGKYEGLDRYECRKQLVQDIKEKGLFVKIEKISHSVAHSERSGCVVEPYLSKQWFVKMEPLAKKSLELQSGENAINFYPDRFKNTLNRWLENLDDWCISRQLWWGHRIPVYYHNDTGNIVVSELPPKDIENYTQDEDVLDTWFSSGLWPFTTLGWPEKTSDYERYFPTSLMVTGYDIIFFWVARMIFQSLNATGLPPFKDVLIHGLVRDVHGKKMSKSSNNGVEPLEIIEKYGADAMRYYLTTSASPGLDMRYEVEKIDSAHNYLNKIWNSARYVLENIGEGFEPATINYSELNYLDKYILIKLDETVKNVTNAMDKYEFGGASTYLYNFVYDEFCSFYLEMSKVSMAKEDNHNTKQVLYKVLKAIILMIYPYAPFISEEIYLSLPKHLDSIMLETYPEVSNLNDKIVVNNVELLSGMIKDIRNYKVEQKLAPNAPVEITICTKDGLFNHFETYLKRFTFAKNIQVVETFVEDSINTFFVYPNVTMIVSDGQSSEEILAKINKELELLDKEILRVENMLKNENFVSKAPAAKIDVEKDKLANFTAKRQSLLEKKSKIN